MRKEWIHSGSTEKEPSALEKRNRLLARRAAAESIVLLKNEQLLPLEQTERVALLGNGAGRTIKGGIGSGDVNNRENISIYRGLLEAGASITSGDWIADYEERYQEARRAWKDRILAAVKQTENPFDAYAANPFALPEGREITAADIAGASAVIYVISRISGEGKDRRLEKGDYYLSEKEEQDLFMLDACQLPIALVINAGGAVELTELLQKTKNIRAVLHISQLGQEGGLAVADILFGRAIPSGKLTATWAKRYQDYPGAASYGYLNGNLEKEEYREGIYVGYRYFDSFGVEPLFPFGYGLSYTSFDIEFEGLEIEDGRIRVRLCVKNTGSCYAGKETVQVYVTPPQGKRDCEYQRLAGFAKTKELQPGEEQRFWVELEQKQLAAFSEEEKQWLIEAGSYGIWVGNSSASTKLQALLRVAETVTIENTHTVCPREEAFAELLLPEQRKRELSQWQQEGKLASLPEYRLIPQQETKRHSRKALPELSYPTEELLPFLYGNITKEASMLGTAGIRVPGSAGESSAALEEAYGISPLIMADGPAGVRLRQAYQVDRQSGQAYIAGVLSSLENGFLEPMEEREDADTYYQFCTAFPVGSALAQTWNPALLEEFGSAVAEEMQQYHVQLWLAPGMNIQRNPLCGRNFEYFSEDPLLSGRLAAAVTKGVQAVPGCGVTIKHFACNNQEDNRMGVDACISERALREIYLRGFEIAVKQSAPKAIMTSYNRVNGVHAANSYDLCTTLAREEWGFEGVIMSDWNTTAPEGGSVPWKCTAAGNDIIMPGSLEDAEDIRRAYAEGRLSEQRIRESAGRVIALSKELTKEQGKE